MRTVLTLITCLAVLTCGLLTSSANAQSAEDLRKWAEQARERMNEEFDKMRGELDRQRERLSDLRDELSQQLDELLGRDSGGNESQPAPEATGGNAVLGIKAGEIDEGMRTLLEIPEGQGVLVREVVAGTPAANVLKTWDVILAIDGKNVGSAADISGVLAGRKPGDKVKVTVLRESQKQTHEVALAAGSGSASGGNTDDLRGLLEESFGEGDVPDPDAEEGGPFGGQNPFGGGQNPFGDGEGMGQLQERLQELFQNPERLQQMMEQFREMMRGRDGQNPFGGGGDNGGDGQNPLGGGLEDFLRGLEGGGQGEGEPTPEPQVRPWIGISGVNPNEDMQAAGATGVVVTRVTENGPAEAAGLQRGDIIVAFGDTAIKNRDDLKLAIDKLEVGDEIKVTFVRSGEKQTTTLTVAAR